ncbi:hypothetical protein BDZ89DRAFT_1052579 [Hymenopellis radicata]|nr:hypothetical protein BDZ89DRAFT_1052579 [Hymenopellis radicata]
MSDAVAESTQNAPSTAAPLSKIAIARQKYGCTCNECTGGYLSPRMRSLLETAWKFLRLTPPRTFNAKTLNSYVQTGAFEQKTGEFFEAGGVVEYVLDAITHNTLEEHREQEHEFEEAPRFLALPACNNDFRFGLDPRQPSVRVQDLQPQASITGKKHQRKAQRVAECVSNSKMPRVEVLWRASYNSRNGVARRLSKRKPQLRN